MTYSVFFTILPFILVSPSHNNLLYSCWRLLSIIPLAIAIGHLELADLDYHSGFSHLQASSAAAKRTVLVLRVIAGPSRENSPSIMLCSTTLLRAYMI
jgi:hypothetical protein